MRLICGLIRWDGAPADARQLAAMAAALTAPGLSPHLTTRVEGPAALAVLDFAAPADAGDGLPHGPDGTGLAADLRLDRPAELATALGLPAATAPEALALAALARWDVDTPDHLHGDVALAHWQPGRRRLLLARDIMGTRPLCWSEQPGRGLAFASLPRALYGSGLVPCRLDPVGVGRLLVEPALGYDVSGMVGIHWVPPGHALAATAEGTRLHRAWRPDLGRIGTWRGTPAEAAEQLRTLIDEAVACRLPADGPVAAHLSGGLDSSAVCVMAARRLRAQGRRLHVFSQMAAPQHAATLRDEREFITAVLEQEPGIAWSPIHLRGFPAHEPPELGVDGPLAPVDEEICAAAAAAGARRLLTGGGGDETATFNGLNLYAGILRQGGWRTLPSELRARARRDGVPLTSLVLRRLVAPLLPAWLRQGRRRLLGRPQPPSSFDALVLLQPALAPQVAAAKFSGLPRNDTPEGRARQMDNPYLAGRATRWATLGARHGVAFCHPLLDRRLIDFTLSLPFERFAHGGWTRQPFRDAMAGVLPEKVRWRDSKFGAFPDLPLVLAANKAALLDRLAALRGQPAAAAIFDLDAIAAVLAAIPEADAAEAWAAEINRRMPPRAFFRQLHALRALALGEHAARLS